MLRCRVAVRFTSRDRGRLWSRSVGILHAFELGFDWSGLSGGFVVDDGRNNCLVTSMLSTSRIRPSEFAAIHGASGSGGCNMSACCRGHGRRDFHADAFRLELFWRWGDLSFFLSSFDDGEDLQDAALRSDMPLPLR